MEHCRASHRGAFLRVTHILGGLFWQAVVCVVMVPGCNGTPAGGGGNAAPKEAGPVPDGWAFHDLKFADSFFAKGSPRARVFLGGQPQVYPWSKDPGAQPRMINDGRAFNFHAWKEDDELVYSVRFIPAKVEDLPAPIDRVNRLADRLDFITLWFVSEKSRRVIDHQGRPGCELEYAKPNAKDSPLWVVLRIIYVAENESACLLQVSSRKAARLGPDDPKVQAFLTRSEIVVPMNPNP